MPKKPTVTTDAVEILYQRLYEGKPERIKGLEDARANDEIARTIFELRTQAGLTSPTARLVGTTPRSSAVSKTRTTRVTPSRCCVASEQPSTNGSKSGSSPSGALRSLGTPPERLKVTVLGPKKQKVVEFEVPRRPLQPASSPGSLIQ